MSKNEMNKHQPFSLERALESGEAKTRDGRYVISLRRVMVDGEPCLVGSVSFANRLVAGRCYQTEEHIWLGLDGLGIHGGDDLVNR